MNDVEKAKIFLQHGDNIVDIKKLPRAYIVETKIFNSEILPTFNEMYFMSDEEKEKNRYIEFDINIKVRGKIKEVAYLYNMKNCAIVPYPGE